MQVSEMPKKTSGDWQPIDEDVGLCADMEVTPYIHWWLTHNQKDKAAVKPCRLEQAALLGSPDDEDCACEEIVPLPDFALAPAGTKFEIPCNLKETTEKPPRNAVITGIIDEGIALGHARFRKMDKGKPTATRVLAAWQQGARYGGPDGTSLGQLPFGHQLLEAEINALMDAHCSGGWLDEDAFNIAAGLTDGSEPMGVTALDRLAAHGTHVLDLAAGYDPNTTSAQDLSRRPILAVTLPRREAVGMAGIFLHFFVVHAMQWIVEVADALWEQHYPGESGGFPVVINLSFGQHAGPKNGTSQIEEAFKTLIATRDPAKAPLRLVMPVGNDNLARGNAYVEFPSESTKDTAILKLPWRVQPEDHSPNFVEIWVECDGHQSASVHPLTLDIELPDGLIIKDITGQHRHYLDLPGNARVYAEGHVRRNLDDPSKVEKQLFHYLISTSASIDETGVNPISPAGIWQISARWDHEKRPGGEPSKVKLYTSVQVDQAVEVGSLRNKRSYFDHPNYETHDQNGRIVDTFRYPLLDEPHDLLDGGDAGFPVQRRGTHNAVATIDSIIVVGGYRLTDGRPAIYSASSHAVGRTPYGGVERIVASLPTETAPAHFGIRAAGPRSAATISMRGTSFAAGMATRQIVNELLDWVGSEDTANPADGSAHSYAQRAAQHEQRPSHFGDAHPIKVGFGRLPASQIRAVDRLTWG